MVPSMPSTLSDIQLKNLKTAGSYRAGPSLYLDVGQKQKRWRLRKQVEGKRKWIYLGSYPAMSPSQARKKAAALLANEESPQAVLHNEKQVKRESAIRVENEKTFQQVTEEYIATKKKPVWKTGAKTANDWANKLERYVLPVIGHKKIDEILKDDIQKILLPIWVTKFPTAKKVRQEVNAIINFAIAKDYSEKANPCTMVEILLPEFHHNEKHYAALPYHDAPTFGFELWNKNEASYDALKLILLTQVRSADAREALWTQFDLQNGVWNCPIKKRNGEEHKLPIPSRLARLLKEKAEISQDERLFPGSGRNKFITSNALDKSLDIFRKTDLAKNRITIHGFRSTFVDWAIDTESGREKDADRQLAHTEKNEVLAAYARTDRFKRRAILLQTYENFCLSDVA